MRVTLCWLRYPELRIQPVARPRMLPVHRELGIDEEVRIDQYHFGNSFF